MADPIDVEYEVIPDDELDGESITPTFREASPPAVVPREGAPLPMTADGHLDLTYESVMRYVQTQQIGLAQELCKGGIPTDKDGAKLFLDALGALSSSATNKRKNEIETTLGESNQAIAQAMADMVRNQMQNQSPFIAAPGTVAAPQLTEAPEGLLDQFDSADGETHIGVISETSEEFTKRMDLLLSEEEKES